MKFVQCVNLPFVDPFSGEVDIDRMGFEWNGEEHGIINVLQHLMVKMKDKKFNTQP